MPLRSCSSLCALCPSPSLCAALSSPHFRAALPARARLPGLPGHGCVPCSAAGARPVQSVFWEPVLRSGRRLREQEWMLTCSRPFRDHRSPRRGREGCRKLFPWRGEGRWASSRWAEHLEEWSLAGCQRGLHSVNEGEAWQVCGGDGRGIPLEFSCWEQAEQGWCQEEGCPVLNASGQGWSVTGALTRHLCGAYGSPCPEGTALRPGARLPASPLENSSSGLMPPGGHLYLSHA